MHQKQSASQPWHLEHGRHAERIAARHLESHGLTMIARNVRCKVGELDLVCLHERVLVVVEVRQRRNEDFGGALASITPSKQRKIVRAAHYFLQAAAEWRHLPLRFDVIAVNGIPDRAPEIVWVKDAFRSA